MTGPDYDRTLAEERLLLDAQEMIDWLLAENDLSRSDLAHRLGRTRSFVSQTLNIGNPTLRTMARMADALGYRLSFRAERIEADDHGA